MQKQTKLLWIISITSFLFFILIWFILGSWIHALFFPLVIFIVSTALALLLDLKFYISILSLKVAQKGMGLGGAILSVLVFLVLINYLSVVYDLKYDVSDGKLNSLSEQSLKVINSSKNIIKVLVYYRGKSDTEIKDQVAALLDLYKNNSKNIVIEFIDAYRDSQRARKDLANIADKDKILLFAEVNGRRIRVKFPFTEQSLTTSIIKATRESQKSIYTLIGHGERAIGDNENEGLSLLKQSLKDLSFDVKELNLTVATSVPIDASMLLVVGPKSNFLAHELISIKKYMLNGGRVFFALDPGKDFALYDLLKKFNFNYRNNYLVNNHIQFPGRGPAGIVGFSYNKEHIITKLMSNYTLFDLVSEVNLLPSVQKDVHTYGLVFSDDKSSVISDLKDEVNLSDLAKRTLMALAEKENQLGYKIVVAGDSDFMSNKDYPMVMNKELSLNIFSYLLDEKDLISIPPVSRKSTKIILTSVKKNFLISIAALIPLCLFFMAGIVWWRRKNA